MVMNLLKIFLIGFIVLGLSNSCSCRLSKEPDGEVLLTDSILAIYQDSMAEAPQKVLDVFSKSVCICRIAYVFIFCYRTSPSAIIT